MKVWWTYFRTMCQGWSAALLVGVFIWATHLAVYSLCSVSSYECLGRHKYRSFSTRTAYPSIQHDTDMKNVVDDIPGCTTDVVYLLLRHGSRYPGADEITAMNTLLPHLKDSIRQSALNGHSILCAEVIEAIGKWNPLFSVDQHLSMALIGLQESFDIGYRLRTRFPSLLNITLKDWHWRMQLRATDSPRSQLSVAALMKGLLLMEMDGSVQAHEQFQASKYARVVNVSHADDHLLLYCDLCQKYVEQRLNKNDSEKNQEALFDSNTDVLDTIKQAGIHLGLQSDIFNLSTVRVIYEACRFEFALTGKSTWCAVLTPEIIQLLEYRQDMKYFWRYGYGRLLNYQPSCLLLNDILQAFRNASRQRCAEKVYLRVGHSRSILPLLARLGLFRDAEPLLSNNYKHHRHRHWRLANINPFSSNIVFSLHSCASKLYVQVFLNERPIILPTCHTFLCPLQTLVKAWKPYVTSCSLLKFCDSILNLAHLDRDLLHHL